MTQPALRPWQGVLEICRLSPRRLNDALLRRQVRWLRGRALTPSAARAGWDCRCRTRCEPGPTGCRYRLGLVLTRTTRRGADPAACQAQFERIRDRVLRAGRRWGWSLPDASAPAAAPSPATVSAMPPAARPAVAIPADWPRYFEHLYDRGPQVRLLLDSLGAALGSGWHVRHHCLLWGRPGCGKTEILLAVERLLGAEAVVKLDATMTSKAGAENLLLELEAVPPVLLIEELEKCDPANLPWLLGVLDQRGEVLKTNARIGSVRKEARCLCLATANDLGRFRAALSGALASRFQHQIYCPRPSREVLRRILLREVRASGGNEAWVEPALDLCAAEGTDDPRRAIALLDGRDRLLTGAYQADWQAIRGSAAAETAGPSLAGAKSPNPSDWVM
jgi:hypothetical protein